jgi:hypothetical protein
MKTIVYWVGVILIGLSIWGGFHRALDTHTSNEDA